MPLKTTLFMFQFFKKLQSSHSTKKAPLFCLAPWSSMSFNIDGTVSVCCYNRKTNASIVGKTIKEVWNGVAFETLREHVEQGDLSYDCQTCLDKLNSGSLTNLKARDYDAYEKSSWPQIMEFCLENTCNLACEMCNTTLSSTIRKNNNLPPLLTKYSDEFIDELEEFIPHLKEAVFVGGEPFLIPSYFTIWEKMTKINPHIQISIVTNGTVLNNRIRGILEGGKFNLNISIDSVDKAIYESIRLNSNFDRLMDNFNWFKEYCLRKNTTLNIPICPLTTNWENIPETVRFAINNNAYINFAYVDKPKSLSLIFQKPDFLSHIISVYEKEYFEGESYQAKQNINKFNDLLQDLRKWKLKNQSEEVCFEGFGDWKIKVLNQVQEHKKNELERLLDKLILIFQTYSEQDQAYIYGLVVNLSSERLYEMTVNKNDKELIAMIDDVIGTTIKSKKVK